jgi:hypothetical protein
LAHPDLPSFDKSFGRWARRVRGGLFGRRALGGMTWGLLVAPALAGWFWFDGRGGLRPWAVLLGAAGALAGAIYGLRRRWSDLEVALYLDAKLGADELLSTAVSLPPDRDQPAELRERAEALLEHSNPKVVRPRLWQRWHWLGLVGVGAIVAVSVVRLPPREARARAEPGQKMVKRSDLAGLDAIIALEGMDGRDEAQRERLRQIAARAKQLRADLARGIESRDALARVAKLRDDIAAERLRFGDDEGRAGLEAAVRKLESQGDTRALGKALGQGDLTEFDQGMQEQASRAEDESRTAARRLLEEAEREARARRAGKVADFLAEERRQFDKEAARADALRELARELGTKLDEDARRDLEEFGATGNPKARARLGHALEKALGKLTDEERRRLAQNLKKKIDESRGAGRPMTAEELDRLSRRLDSRTGEKELAEALRQLAKPEASREARRGEGLDDADRGGAQAQRELGAIPLPMEGAPSPGGAPSAAEQRSNDPGSPGPGSKKDYGTGPHEGKTEPITAESLRAKTRARMNPGAPMQGTSLGRAPAVPGETAIRAGPGAIGSAGPTEIGAVDRAEIPEEYREQVGRYFSP